MAIKQNISDFRERLDKTLASHDLANEEFIKTLVKNQLLRSSPSKIDGYNENVVDRRTVEVSNFLDMLRSASGNDNAMSKNHGRPQTNWKLKQDNEESRIMYREGPQGTPFHTLLVEGYINAPLDVCLCVSWESALYTKWWPQFSIPTFKVISSNCLQKVQIGEQISLVRMKVSWPLSAREAVVHYFALDYLEEDLVIVLLNSVSDLKSIDRITHGFTNDGIPEAKDIVRIDLVGGFAIQKVTSDRSYFRTIVTMDMKLDFVPPSFINFISRKLIGNGFKLYQKAVTSVAKDDEDFGKILEDPLYTRVREGLSPSNKLKKALEPEQLKSEKIASILPEEHPLETLQAQIIDQTSLGEDHAINTLHTDKLVIDQKYLGEIEEEKIERDIQLEDSIESESIDHSPTNQNTVLQCPVSKENKVSISPEVETALGTLDKVISMVRRGGFSAQTWYQSVSTNQDFQNLEKVAEVGSMSTENGGVFSGGGVCVEEPKVDRMDKRLCVEAPEMDRMDKRVCVEAPKIGRLDKPLDEPKNGSCIHNSRCTGPDSSSSEVKHNRIAPAESEQKFQILGETQKVAFCSSDDGATTEAPILDDMTTTDYKQVSPKANGIHDISNGERKMLRQHKKKQRLCCLHFISGCGCWFN